MSMRKDDRPYTYPYVDKSEPWFIGEPDPEVAALYGGDEPRPSAHLDKFLVEVGRIVFCWNEFEEAVKLLILAVSGFQFRQIDGEPSAEARILIANMQSANMVNICRSIAQASLPTEQRESMTHVASLLDDLARVRNAIVHEFRAHSTEYDVTPSVVPHQSNGGWYGQWIAAPKPESTRAVLYGTSIRSANGLKQTRVELEAADLQKVARTLAQATKYTRKVLHYYRSILGHVSEEEAVRSPPEKYVLLRKGSDRPHNPIAPTPSKSHPQSHHRKKKKGQARK